MKENKSKVITIILMVIVGLLFVFNLVFSIRSCSSERKVSAESPGSFETVTFTGFQFGAYFPSFGSLNCVPQFTIGNSNGELIPPAFYAWSEVANRKVLDRTSIPLVSSDGSSCVLFETFWGGSAGSEVFNIFCVYEGVNRVCTASVDAYGDLVWLFNNSFGYPDIYIQYPFSSSTLNLKTIYTGFDSSLTDHFITITGYSSIRYTWQFSDNPTDYFSIVYYYRCSNNIGLRFADPLVFTLLGSYSYSDWRNGYDTGYQDGYSLGYSVGADIPTQALDSAYNSGLQTGYQSGISEQFDDIDPFHVIVTFVNDFLSIQVFRGVTVSTIFSIQFGFILLGLALKFFLGG